MSNARVIGFPIHLIARVNGFPFFTRSKVVSPKTLVWRSKGQVSEPSICLDIGLMSRYFDEKKNKKKNKIGQISEPVKCMKRAR
jgi:hypothetical protein